MRCIAVLTRKRTAEVFPADAPNLLCISQSIIEPFTGMTLGRVPKIEASIVTNRKGEARSPAP